MAPTQFTRHVILQTYKALTSFSKDCGTFPSETQGLNALSVDPGLKKWDGPYISERRCLDDVWQHPLQYALGGADPFVVSLRDPDTERTVPFLPCEMAVRGERVVDALGGAAFEQL